MLSPDEVADRVGDMITARAEGRKEDLITLLDDVITGPRRDSLNVALVLAGVLSEDLGDHPEGGFHKIEVTRFDDDGVPHRESVTTLPGHVATFVQMVAAIGNKEPDTARDLFLGYVGDDGHRALSLLVLGINEVMHANFDCPDCPGVVNEGAHDEA